MFKKFIQLCILSCLVGLLVIAQTGFVSAGIYDAETETSYKEYWVPHSEFTGGFARTKDSSGATVAVAGCPDASGGGAWYLEPWPGKDIDGDQCNKVLEFTIPDDISQASRAEIYIDLWRAQSGHVYFSLNDGSFRRANVGYDWSRSPYVGEIPLTELKQGINTLTVLGVSAGYHIHDIAVRIYFDDAHPLSDANGNQIIAPQGALISVVDDNGSKPSSQGGALMVDSDQLVLNARTTSPTTFIEFHAFYEGYDVDVDGVARDWQNRGRNNWHPGGTQPRSTGGTIDHISTVMTSGGPGDYATTWRLDHVLNQAGVMFKIRLIREIVEAGGQKNYVVTEAAGGVSEPFKLVRSRAVMAFMVDDFQDTVLCHRNLVVDGQTVCSYPEEVTYEVDIPVIPDSFGETYFLGSYWRSSFVSINDNAQTSVFGPGQDEWQLGVKSMPVSYFQQGQNRVKYIYDPGPGGASFGQFIEQPGPMIVLAQTSSSSDSTAPTATLVVPSTTENAPVDTGVTVALSEMVGQVGHGVDRSTIRLWVDNKEVTPSIEGFSNLYHVVYQPPTPFPGGQTVEVGVEACDLAGNCLNRTNFIFDIAPVDEPFAALSDDFNACVLNENVIGEPWVWDNLHSGQTNVAGYQMTGSHFAITTPADITVDDGPRLFQSVNNDPLFELQMKFSSSLEQDGQAQGALIMADANNYLQIYFERTEGQAALVATKVVDGATEEIWRRPLTSPSGQGPFYLRIRRIDKDWEIAYSLEGPDSTWITGPDYMLAYDLTVTQVGLFAANSGDNGDFTALVDYFFNMDAPIVPQDVRILNYADLQPDITIDPLSSPAVGSVNGKPANPTNGNPTCGTPLALTATPAPGWAFDHWRIFDGAGSIESSVNPLTRDFMQGESVTALFKARVYRLSVTTIHDGDGVGGTVSITPDQPSYSYNDEVTLNAQSEPGWVFSGWGGDLPVDADPVVPSLVLAMDEDKSITATFTQNQYALDIDVGGSGHGAVSVKIDDALVAPPPAVYQVAHGQTVFLRAFAAQDGSNFGGWSGDLPTGSDPLSETLAFTLTRARSLRASFVFGVALATNVSPEGSGQIMVDPHKDEYTLGEEVNLQAISGPDWRFVEWRGDLPPGIDPTVSALRVIMDDDKSISAVFDHDVHTIYLPITNR